MSGNRWSADWEKRFVANSASDENFPCGRCECNQGCPCEKGAGPAAYLILRNGVQMKVCTRCTLSGDEKLKLLVTEEMSPMPFLRWDPDTACILAFELEEEAKANGSTVH